MKNACGFSVIAIRDRWWLSTEWIFYHGILGPHGKREQVLPSPHALVFIPCVRCVPWLTTEQIFYHGILGLHGKREQDVRGPHALVFISVCSVCSVVDHRADFLPRNTRTKRKKRTGPSQSSCPGLHFRVFGVFRG
jgi:hypothetical protein